MHRAPSPSSPSSSTAALASAQKPLAASALRVSERTSAEEEAVLAGITACGEFSLEKVSKMYEGVRRLSDDQ